MNPAEPSLSQDALPAGDPAKGIYFIAISQFGIAFSFNCIMSFMPFYILKVSAYGMKETMLWIGMIMGATSMVAALAAPFWGGLTARIRPKLLFEIGIFCNGVIFFIMGFVESLPLLLTLRLIQGALGGVSTIGLVPNIWDVLQKTSCIEYSAVMDDGERLTYFRRLERTGVAIRA